MGKGSSPERVFKWTLKGGKAFQRAEKQAVRWAGVAYARQRGGQAGRCGPSPQGMCAHKRGQLCVKMVFGSVSGGLGIVGLIR